MTDPDVDLSDPYPRDDLTVDQQLALRTAAVRLGDEFADLYGEETIERFLHASYDQFAVRSTVAHFLPLLAERFARIHPETEFMFMAGLPDSPEVCDEILSRGRAFLPKPFVPRTLLDKVYEVLGGELAARR